MKLALCVLFGALLAAELAGCAVAEGPLDYGAAEGGSSSVCAPGEKNESILFGDHFRANGETTIDQVELVGAQGMQLLDVWLLPEGGIGSAEYPPVGNAAWNERRSALNAEVQPGKWVNLVVRVVRTGSRAGSADSVAIVYTSGGVQFRKAGTQSYTVRGQCF